MKTLQLPPFTPTPGANRSPSESTSSGHGDEFRRLVRNGDSAGHREGRSPRDVEHSRAPGHSTSAKDIEAQDPDAAPPDADEGEGDGSPDQAELAQFPAMTALIVEPQQSYRQWSKTAENGKIGIGIGQSHQTHGVHAAKERDQAGLAAGAQSVTDPQEANSADTANATAARESAQAVPAGGIEASSSKPLASEQVRGSIDAQQLYAREAMRRASDNAVGPQGATAADQAFLKNSGGADIDPSSFDAQLNGPFSDLRSDDGVAAAAADGRSEATDKNGRSGSARGDAALSTEITLAAARYGVKSAEKNASQTESVTVILPRAELMAAERHASTLTPAGTVASAIGSEPSWRPAAVAAISQTPSHLATNGHATLQVQLTPHHLGVVTARLILSGGQLEVEIEASSADAHEHLKGEEHVIEKAIRSLGYDVGQVRITQSFVASTATKDDSALPTPTPQTRDQTSDNAMSSGSEGRSSGHHGGWNEGERSGGLGERAPHDPDRSHRGIYI